MKSGKSRWQPSMPGLRREADTRLAGFGGPPDADRPARSGDELVHELQVHQNELEMQNDELRRSRLALETARDRYADLYDFASVGYFTLATADARIVEVNLTGAALLGVPRGELVGRHFRVFVDPDERGRWAEHVAVVLRSTEKHDCELTMRRSDGSPFAAHLDSLRSASSGDQDAPFVVRTALSDVSAMRRAENERAAQAARLNELSRRLAAVQDAERRRLAGELHDRSSPNLSALSLNLSLITAALPTPRSPELDALLADTRSLIDDTTASIRDLCTDLRPPVVDYAGLLAALESNARLFARRTGIAVTIDGERFRTRPAPQVESSLLRIAREALTNCAKHSRAGTIRIVLATEGGQVVLTIADDGVGFEPRAIGDPDPRGGLGLITMGELAESVGGTFRVESSPGRGTRIEVRV